MVRAVFMGSDSFSVPCLRLLLERGRSLATPVETVGVVTQPDRPAGRGRKLRSNPVKALADEAGVPALTPEKLRQPESLAAVLDLAPELVVVASFGQLLPRALLEAPRWGCINLHPSLLPRHRGPSPVQGAILAGDRQTGVTLMLMAVKMDAGPIVGREVTDVGLDETAGELLGRLARVSAGLLWRELPRWLEGRIVPAPQDEAGATYTTRIHKSDGWVEWHLPAELLARRVRAYNPWPTAFTTWRGKQLRLLRAAGALGGAPPGRVLSLDGPSLMIGTGEGLLRVSTLQIEGGRPLPADAFVRGHHDVLGATLGTDVPWSSA